MTTPPSPPELLFSVMRLARFELLPEYSCTIPTGPKPGFRFRRREPYGVPIREATWFLCEVEKSPDPELVELHWTRLVVAEWTAGDALAELFND